MPTAVITGASRGLGRALAEEMARRGWRLILDARGADQLDEVATALAAKGSRVTAVPGDVTDPAHREHLAALTETGLDALVNNAGALGPSPLPPLLELDPAELDRLFHVNVTAQLALVQTLAPRLRPGGVVVNITSDAAVEAYPGWGGYGASKAALERISAVLAVENPQLRVFAFDPGDMRTRMHQEAYPGEDISGLPPPEEVAPRLADLIEAPPASVRVSVSELRAER